MAKILPSTGPRRVHRPQRPGVHEPPPVRFYEMEYAIPREALPEALNRVRRLVDEIGHPAQLPGGGAGRRARRHPAVDRLRARASGYIAVHVYQGTPYDAYFQGVERIMDGYGGRPHWGKMHFQRAETLAARYPRGTSSRVRARLDPEGRFANPYLDRVPRPGCWLDLRLSDLTGDPDQYRR